jgi:hypothetical protein
MTTQGRVLVNRDPGRRSVAGTVQERDDERQIGAGRLCPRYPSKRACSADTDEKLVLAGDADCRRWAPSPTAREHRTLSLGKSETTPITPSGRVLDRGVFMRGPLLMSWSLDDVAWCRLRRR